MGHLHYVRCFLLKQSMKIFMDNQNLMVCGDIILCLASLVHYIHVVHINSYCNVKFVSKGDLYNP